MRPSPLLHTKSTGDILTPARSELQVTKPIIKLGKEENLKNPKEDESEDDEDDKDNESDEHEVNKKTNAKSGDYDGNSANKGPLIIL